ncbi:membrane protein involved in colicin uptake [Pseudomonas nitritireducens]|uniref:Membrane protein involved in colicin uptake n=1 Tax=Pseudomonas nitroreducens TaxID=46680 RepID=A0A7W7KID0_PSENT|nr:DUF2514 family protein [Pseudomonas nitritireducens]MBB4863365.1 membrane protein involved in colicin uptake [Pseudomonas nitritireducens]
MTWLLTNWKPLLAGLALFLAAAGGWHEGSERTDAAWQAKWDQHEKADQQAAEAFEAREHAEEQRRQLSVNKVIEDADRKIDQVRANSSAAADQRVRDAAAKYADRIAAAEAGRHSCTAAASKAAAQRARVLADMLGEVDRMAGVYAEAADESRVRGLACEAAYDGIR